MPVAQIGSKRTIAFSSSTWVTVQSLHGLGDSLMLSDCITTAALSKKLSFGGEGRNENLEQFFA